VLRDAGAPRTGFQATAKRSAIRLSAIKLSAKTVSDKTVSQDTRPPLPANWPDARVTPRASWLTESRKQPRILPSPPPNSAPKSKSALWGTPQMRSGPRPFRMTTRLGRRTEEDRTQAVRLLADSLIADSFTADSCIADRFSPGRAVCPDPCALWPVACGLLPPFTIAEWNR
jgi:hypothetical protein